MAADHITYHPFRFNRLAKAARLHAISGQPTGDVSQQEAEAVLLLADMQQIMTSINRYTLMFNAWSEKGRQVFDMSEPMNALAGQNVSKPANIPEEGYPDAFYVHFGPGAMLKTSAGDFIDGSLVTITDVSGKSVMQCALVCGPENDGVPTGASFAQILRTQGRLAFATADVDSLTELTLSHECGDPSVRSDEVMAQALARLQLALTFLAEPKPDLTNADDDDGLAFKPF